MLAALPIVDRQPGWTFGTYVFRDRMGGYGMTFARPIGTHLRSREELEAAVSAGREPRLSEERQAETVLRWDELELAGYLWASVAARELKQLGGDWHGLWWSTEYFVGGVGPPVLAGGEESWVSDAPPDLAAFSFQAEAPSRWDPRVCRSADGEVSVEFFTFGARDGERLWRHREVYSPGSTVPRAVAHGDRSWRIWLRLLTDADPQSPQPQSGDDVGGARATWGNRRWGPFEVIETLNRVRSRPIHDPASGHETRRPRGTLGQSATVGRWAYSRNAFSAAAGSSDSSRRGSARQASASANSCSKTGTIAALRSGV